MNLFNKAVLSLVNRSAGSLSEYPPLFNYPGALSTTKEGKKINHNSAFKISAFWGGINTIANSLALLPKSIYKATDKERTRATAHPVDYLIHSEPSELMTAFSFWFTMAVSLLVRGNAYALITRNASGRVLDFRYLDPTQVNPVLYEGALYYKYGDQVLNAMEVIHLTNFTLNGIYGRSVLEYAADSMGISLGSMEYAANAYSDRGVSYGVLESDQEINDIGRKNLNTIFNNAMNNGDKYKLAIFDEGLKYKSITLTPSESKFIEAQAQGVEDVARWLSIPLHKLHTKGEGGYNFLVQMSIEYLQTAVMPIGQKIKEELERKVLTPQERKAGYYVQLNYKKLLEADPKARAQYYKDMVFMGAMSRNEVRALEDFNPFEGGDEFLQMSNLMNPAQIDNTLKNE